MSISDFKIKIFNNHKGVKDKAIPIYFGIPKGNEELKQIAKNAKFKFFKSGNSLPIYDTDGNLKAVLYDYPAPKASRDIIAAIEELYPELPKGYNFKPVYDKLDKIIEPLALGWGFAQYDFKRHSHGKRQRKQSFIHVPELSVDTKTIERQVQLNHLVQYMMQEQADIMSPKGLSDLIKSAAKEFNGAVKELVFNDQNKDQAPLLHSVGRAALKDRGSDFAPRIVDITFGSEKSNAPAITLVGKGLTFDSGGLNIKDGSMGTMQMDMGGAAHALATAVDLVESGSSLKVRLICPIAENAVSGSSYRPSDVITSRNGKTVEIGDTDAEGRLALADALDYANEVEPKSKLTMTFATLTGAADEVTGALYPSVMGWNKTLLKRLDDNGEVVGDPLQTFNMQKYNRLSDKVSESNTADIKNYVDSDGGHILGAAFLSHFVKRPNSFVHFDIASAIKEQPEPMGWRAVSKTIQKHYG